MKYMVKNNMTEDGLQGEKRSLAELAASRLVLQYAPEFYVKGLQAAAWAE